MLIDKIWKYKYSTKSKRTLHWFIWFFCYSFAVIDYNAIWWNWFEVLNTFENTGKISIQSYKNCFFKRVEFCRIHRVISRPFLVQYEFRFLFNVKWNENFIQVLILKWSGPNANIRHYEAGIKWHLVEWTHNYKHHIRAVAIKVKKKELYFVANLTSVFKPFTLAASILRWFLSIIFRWIFYQEYCKFFNKNMCILCIKVV